MRPSAKHPAAFFNHERDTVTAALTLGVGHVAEPDASIAQLGYLLASYEHIGFHSRRKNPSIAEANAHGQAERLIEVVGIAPVAAGTAGGGASQIVVQIAIAEAEVGRERHPAAWEKIQAGDHAGLEDQIGNIVLRSRTAIGQGAVRLPNVDPGEQAAWVGVRIGAGRTPPVAAEFREVG